MATFRWLSEVGALAGANPVALCNVAERAGSNFISQGRGYPRPDSRSLRPSPFADTITQDTRVVFLEAIAFRGPPGAQDP